MKYSSINRSDLVTLAPFNTLPGELTTQINTVSKVLPFRVNAHILTLIDWKTVPEDPIFRLIFPDKAFLSPEDYQTLRALDTKDSTEKQEFLNHFYQELRPNPSNQLQNIPLVDGNPLEGVQHKYRETVLIFPQSGQTCYAFCSYCFRWEQFAEDMPKQQLLPRNIHSLLSYLRKRQDVTDIILTGGDPLFMNAKQLMAYLEPLLHSDFDHIKIIRIGTKAISYWPYRFLTAPDIKELFALFDTLITNGKHITFMANINHPRELKPSITRQAIQVIRQHSIEIRTQSPLLKNINDDAQVLKELWETEVELGCIPYYLFIPRNTGPRKCFEISIHRAVQLFQTAYQNISGLVKTVRGPVMSTDKGKVHVIGTRTFDKQKIFVLEYIQARDSSLIRIPFFAQFDAQATWFDALKPLSSVDDMFFHQEQSSPQ